MNLITILNLFSVILPHSRYGKTFINYWIIIQIIINLVLCIEMIGDWYIFGLRKAYRNHFRIWPESICQIINVFAIYYFVKNVNNIKEYNNLVKLFEVIVFVRLLKLLTLLYEVQVMRIIFETLRNLLGPLKNLLAVMITIMYVFTEIGMAIFGGQVTTKSSSIVHDSSIPDNYYLMNFNDLLSGMVTLFVLIVVNNWYVIVAMFVDIKGGNIIYRAYFMVFYYFGVVIGLNIVIAFAIDMYSAVNRLDEQKEKNRKQLVTMADKQHGEFFAGINNSLLSANIPDKRNGSDSRDAEIEKEALPKLSPTNDEQEKLLPYHTKSVSAPYTQKGL